ncbi:MAG: TRAP transporter substrate-binding protein DctP [Candidatus Anstonellales archaeon]
MKKISMLIGLAMLISLMVTQVTEAQQTFKFRMPNLMPKGIVGWEWYQDFCNTVKQASNGRIEITLYGVGELMPALETWDALSKGVIEMNWSSGLYWAGKSVASDFAVGLPYTTRNWNEMCSLLWNAGIEEYVRKHYAKHNIYLLGIWPIQSTTLVTKFPVTKVSDLKGKKIRAGGIQAQVLGAAGAAATYLPVPEVYGALQSGVVDGCVLGGLVAAGVFSLHEVAKYGVLPPMVAGATEDITINMDVWKKLPDDLKTILTNCVRSHYTKWVAWQRNLRSGLLQKMAEKGFKFSTMPKEEYDKLRKIAMGVYEEKAKKSPEFAEGYAIVKKFMETIGSWEIID